MRSYTLEFDGYDRYAIYPNQSENRRYPPIPVWKKRFFDPAAFTTRKLKQCFVDRQNPVCFPSGNQRTEQSLWGNTATLRLSNLLDASQTANEILEPLTVWKKHPFLFLSLASMGLFLWLSAHTIQEFETASGFAATGSRHKPDQLSVAGLQFPVIQVNQTSASLIAAIDPARLDPGAILGSGRHKTAPLKPGSKEVSLSQMGQGILERLSDRNPLVNAFTRTGANSHSGHKQMAQFLLPVTGYPITSPFGSRIHPIFGDRQLHTGIDIGTPSGTPVRAAAGGFVTFAGWNGGYGNLIIISHARGYETFYAHLDELHVAAGDRVSQGKIIGLSGSTGYVTGPHLHFEIRFNQVAINPMNYLAKFVNHLGLL